MTYFNLQIDEQWRQRFKEKIEKEFKKKFKKILILIKMKLN